MKTQQEGTGGAKKTGVREDSLSVNRLRANKGYRKKQRSKHVSKQGQRDTRSECHDSRGKKGPKARAHAKNYWEHKGRIKA